MISPRTHAAGRRAPHLRYASGITLFAVLLLAALSSAGAPAAATDWPEFRGPQGDGHAVVRADKQPAGLPLTWSDTENVRWKTEIPLRGLSTPVVLGGQVWLTTATPDGHDFFALCLDAATGQIVFNERLFHSDEPEPLGNAVNSYATPSPAIEPGRVYIHFGSYGTACLDTATRKIIWSRQDLRCRHFRGPSSSPIIFENLLVLTFDGVDVQYLIALDKQTGKTVWKTDRSVAWNDENVPGKLAKEGDLRKAHSTPLIVTVAGRPHLLTAGAKAAYGYDPRTGGELWRVQYNAWSASARPVYRDGLAFLNTGFGGQTELWAVRVDGRGDVTDTHVAWKTGKIGAKTPSPILVDDLLYVTSDDGLLTCFEAATGREVWRERLGGNFAASPVYADGRLYFCNQQGKTTVLTPGRTFAVAATNTLPSGCMASPAVADRALFLRTKTHFYRLEAVSAAGAP
jgi:outer membrane protein assembly factor BamB